MKTLRLIAALGLAVSLSACGGMQPVSRASLPDATALSITSKSGPNMVAPAAQYDVAEVRISVPQNLRVSEANMFYPIADIVWRGEPLGDRHAQVKAIFEEAFATGTQAMHQGRKVIVEAEVTRFHCLTEKTRYTVGGTHSMKFTLTLRDAATGQIIDGPRLVVADVKASGGNRALAEELAGRTQRVVVLERLAQVIRQELSQPQPLPDAGAVPTSRLESDLILTPVALRD
ncbi:DUF6778 family protein [Rhodobacter ferrooxidans]|uniref:Putative lipoprotein n=1 Tax=Rhodobacter ferrooxidans TaxID=371731 RepID=C8RXY8_9RHOB|nr:DUF6778 family protein [Rhodobacter sp. SW2]EEW26386.1 putative lipoprotein [Rhodobacter sp. SW2]